MPTWGQLLIELNSISRAQPQGVPAAVSPQDLLRRKYLTRLSDITGRATIVYATRWLEPNPSQVSPESLSVVLGDLQAFMETCSNIQTRDLDLILTSPGGDPTAAESIMAYLRDRFDNIRAIVPVAAMSAATMMALACDEIVMGMHSQLGPVDPQITVSTPEGPRISPAQAILDQFEMAKKECEIPANIGAWLPMLRALLPGLLAYCADQQELARKYAEEWLTRYMLASEDIPETERKAKEAADFFTDYTERLSHSRPVRRDEARIHHLKIVDLESDPEFQDAVLSVHHAVRHTFGTTPTVKLVENHLGRAYIESFQVLQFQGAAPAPLGSPAPSLAEAPQHAPVRQVQPNREQRRRKGR